MEEVRVRFAPSPTGFLHVGGARTAIFNWLFARNRNGKFLLRIEDTDPARSKSELTRQIVDSLNWMGMNSDEPVVYQSDRIERYREIVTLLVKQKKAYPAFETPEELEEKRKAVQQKKLSTNYDRSSLKYDDETVRKFIQEGKPYSVRFFIPEGITEFNDLVHGSTSFQNSEIDDFVILRSDGSPTYQISVVIDDHDMNITHVIRGDDHLTNTPKQILLYNALGWEIPEFAHLPMIMDEGKKKLSKRRNTVSVGEYREKGYLPEALFNFLTLLGFAPNDNREIISKDELVKIFSLDKVNKKSAVFDMNKLNWMNFQYIKSADKIEICRLIREKLSLYFPDSVPDVTDEYIYGIIRLMTERVQTINEFIEKGICFFNDPESYDQKGMEKYLNNNVRLLLKDYLESLNKMSPADFSSENIESHLREFSVSNGVKASVIIHPLRLALTGSTASPGIFELIELLGFDTVVRRIKKILL